MLFGRLKRCVELFDVVFSVLLEVRMIEALTLWQNSFSLLSFTTTDRFKQTRLSMHRGRIGEAAGKCYCHLFSTLFK